MNIHRKLKLLADKDVRNILVATFLSPRSAYELCSKYAISIASCYRKINLLIRAGFLSVRKTILSQEGKVVRLFQANLDKGHIHIENNRIVLKFVLAPDEYSELQTWECIEVL